MSLDERIGAPVNRSRSGRQVDRDERQERADMSAAQTSARDDDDFLDDWADVALPNIPNIPGYHVCYLSTTHGADSLHKRLQAGYTPVRPEDIPGHSIFAAYGVQSTIPMVSGDVLQVNEMIACKIPNDRYQRIMAARHHNKPLEQEYGLARYAEMMAADHRSAPTDYDAGYEEVAFGVNNSPKRAPDFIRAGF